MFRIFICSTGQGTADILAATLASIHKATRGRASVSEELKAHSRRHHGVVIAYVQHLCANG